MGTCMARRGFLTLSDCENPATTACSNCGRMMCPVHLSPTSGFSMCLDCAATVRTGEEGKEGKEGETGEQEYNEEWAAGYRNDYYSSTRYAPVYTGSHHDTYYDGQDVRSFDSEEQGIVDDDEDRGGFGDS